MYSVEDILAALQSGTEADKIAKDFTDNLNKAIAQDKEIKAQAQKAQATAKARVNALADICDQIADFIETFYPDMYDEKMFDQIKVEELDKAINDAYEEVQKSMPLLNALKDLQKQVDETGHGKVNVKLKNSDEAINAFLKRYGL